MGAQKSIASGSEARKRTRSRVLFKAVIRSADHDAEARIRDLSSLGALIEMDQPPAAASVVLFLKGNYRLSARIVWVDGLRAGLQFEAPVNEKALLAQPVPIQPKAPAPRLVPGDATYRRPAVQSNTMSDEERLLARVWADQMGLSFED